MLKIRLRRMGAIRQPHYRIVVADSRSPRDGRFLESLGHYNPLTNPATIQINIDKYEEWKKKGAQPTHAVISLVRQFNRTARNAATAETEAAPQSRQTRTASGKRSAKPQVAEVAPEATVAEAIAADVAPMAEVAEADVTPEPEAEAPAARRGRSRAAAQAPVAEAESPTSEAVAEPGSDEGEGSEAITGETEEAAPDDAETAVVEEEAADAAPEEKEEG